MPTLDNRRKTAELRMQKNALELKEKTLQHQMTVIIYAISAFSEGPTRIAKIPLGPSQSKRTKEGVATIKRLLPKQLRIVTDAAEELSKNAHIPIPLLPLLVRLKEDLERDIATVMVEIAGVQQDIDALSREK